MGQVSKQIAALRAVGEALLTTFVCAAVLGFACHVLLPQFVDPYPPPSPREKMIGNVIGAGVLTVAALLGVLVGVRSYKRRPE
jgi:hypothetical protein